MNGTAHTQIHTHCQPSWMKAQIEQTIRGRRENMPSGQAITSYHVGGKPNLQFGPVTLTAFWGVNYFNHLLTGCNCSGTADNVYS